MKHPILKTVAAVAAIGVAAFAAVVLIDRPKSFANEGVSPIVTPAGLTRVQRGEYLTKAADCVACHTAPGGQPYVGGLAFKMPFGTLYSPNITPDQETGIGGYTDEEFIRAMHEGIGKGNKKLYPAFSYTSYSGLTRQDTLDIKAYLFSLPAVKAPAKKNELMFPFNQRWALPAWNIVFHHPKAYQADPKLSEQVNRGKYLATALGHCGECHTPRNLAQAMVKSKEFGGGLLEGERAYNISSDKTYGVGSWTDAQLLNYLKYGWAENHGIASGKMAEVVEYSTRHLTDSDAQALVAYIRSVEPVSKGPLPVASTEATKVSTLVGPGPDQPQSHGRRIFEGACASCHAWNGTGSQVGFTALNSMKSVGDASSDNMIKVILHGAHAPGAPGFMPAFAADYSDADIAAVTNYVHEHFGGVKGKATPKKVAALRGH